MYFSVPFGILTKQRSKVEQKYMFGKILYVSSEEKLQSQLLILILSASLKFQASIYLIQYTDWQTRTETLKPRLLSFASSAVL